MSDFSDLMESNPPRLVVMYQPGQDGVEQLQWGVVGKIPLLALIGQVSIVQTEIASGTWIAEADGEPAALVIVWDETERCMRHYLSPLIPTLPLLGMLETVKALLVASRVQQQHTPQRGLVLGPDGRPMRM